MLTQERKEQLVETLQNLIAKKKLFRRRKRSC